MNKTQKFLTEKKATPTERKLYEVAQKLYKKLGVPLRNSDLRRRHKSHRTNITQHITSMCKKGLFVRHSRDWFLPVEITAQESRR